MSDSTLSPIPSAPKDVAELFALAVKEDNRIRFLAGHYLLEEELHLDTPHTLYDFTDVILDAPGGDNLVITGEDITLVGGEFRTPVVSEMEAGGLGLYNCIFRDGVLLHGEGAMAKNNLFASPFESYGEGLIFENNLFRGNRVEFFDSSDSLLYANTFENARLWFSCGRNNVLLENIFTEPKAVALTCSQEEWLTLRGNLCPGGIQLENCKYTLVNQTTCPLFSKDCHHTYGDAIPKNMPEYGADEDSLPPNTYTRFQYRYEMAREFVTLWEGDKGERRRISVPQYLEQLTSGNRLLLPPGIYSVPAGEHVHLCYEGLRDATLMGYGVLLLLEDYTRSFLVLKDCIRFSLLGLSVDFREVANTQGTVLAVKDDISVLWKADEGYPRDLLDSSHFSSPLACEGFRKRQDRPFRDLWAPEAIPADEKGQFILRFKDPHRLKAQDKLIFRGRFAHVNLWIHCEETLAEDVTLYNGSGFGFMEYTGVGGSVLRRVLLTPGAPPTPSSPERLISVCDATHSTSMRRGIRVYDSLFEKMTDDATNVNGSYGDVFSLEETEGGFLLTYGIGSSNYSSVCDDFVPGDRVLIYTKAGKLLCDTRALSASRELPEGQKAEKTLLIADRFVLEQDTVIENASANGNGFAFENSLFANNRSRGLLIKASEGHISHCTLRDHGMSAILVKAEIEDGWGECGFSENLLLCDNLIERTGYFTGSELHTPIHISGDSTPVADPLYHNQKHITVRHNKIAQRYTLHAISVNMAEDIVIEENDTGTRVESYKDFSPALSNPLAPDDDRAIPIHLRGVGAFRVEKNQIPSSAEKEYLAE